MRTTLLVTAVALALLAESAAAAPAIHSHRGGSVLAGVPTFAEETMPAFRHAWERERTVLELDVKLTKDRVPVVIHDDTLDRTTTCEGAVSSATLEQFRACRADVLGSGSRTAPAPPPFPELPTLAEVLDYARDSGATVNLEIKNLPGDNDFDASDAYANTVMDVVLSSRIPAARVIVQSFWPANLDAARAKLPAAELSFLTLKQANDRGPEFARSRGYQWVSPEGVPGKSFVERAHGMGIKVVPYTLNEPADVKAAAEAGVDALITDDPVMARRALGGPEPGDPRRPSTSPSPELRVTLAPVARRLRTVRRRGWLPVRVGATQTARITLVATRGRRVIARRTVTVTAGERVVGLRIARRRLIGRRATLSISAPGAQLRMVLRR